MPLRLVQLLSLSSITARQRLPSPLFAPAPVPVQPGPAGETITAHIEVMEVKTAPLHTARCRTAIVKEDGSTATEGEAMVMLPPPEAPAAAAGAAGAAGSSAAPLR